MQKQTATALAVCLALTACQSSGVAKVESETTQTTELGLAATDPDVQPGAEMPPEGAPPATVLASAPPAPGQCMMALAGGPPPKPAKGADFGKAVVKDTGKNVKRNLITMIGGQLGGQIGAAVASGIATSEVRSEGDLAGTWMITDLRPDCACQIEIRTGVNLRGKSSDKGRINSTGCNSPALQRVANWALGYSFTGYDAKFELKAKDNRTVLATLNRDGIHYFSGTLADGAPVVMWRDGQNYSSFKKN